MKSWIFLLLPAVLYAQSTNRPIQERPSGEDFVRPRTDFSTVPEEGDSISEIRKAEVDRVKVVKTTSEEKAWKGREGVDAAAPSNLIHLSNETSLMPSGRKFDSSAGELQNKYGAREFTALFGSWWRLKTAFHMSQTLEKWDYDIRLRMENAESTAASVSNKSRAKSLTNSDLNFFDLGFALAWFNKGWRTGARVGYGVRREGTYSLLTLPGTKLSHRDLSGIWDLRYTAKRIKFEASSENELGRSTLGESLMILDSLSTKENLRFTYSRSELNRWVAGASYSFKKTKAASDSFKETISLHTGLFDISAQYEIFKYFLLKAGFGLSLRSYHPDFSPFYMWPDVSLRFKKWKYVHLAVGISGHDEETSFSKAYLEERLMTPAAPGAGERRMRSFLLLDASAGKTFSFSLIPSFDMFSTRTTAVLDANGLKKWELTTGVQQISLESELKADLKDIFEYRFSLAAAETIKGSLSLTPRWQIANRFKVTPAQIPLSVRFELVNQIKESAVKYDTNGQSRTVNLNDRTLIHLGLSYKIKNKIELFALAENLLDEKRLIVPGAPDTQRTFYIGSTIEF